MVQDLYVEVDEKISCRDEIFINKSLCPDVKKQIL